MPLTLILRHINHNANVHIRLLVHDDMNNIYKDLKIIQFKGGILFQCINFPSLQNTDCLLKSQQIKISIIFPSIFIVKNIKI